MSPKNIKKRQSSLVEFKLLIVFQIINSIDGDAIPPTIRKLHLVYTIKYILEAEARVIKEGSLMFLLLGLQNYQICPSNAKRIGGSL